MGTSKRLAPYYDIQVQHREIMAAARKGQVQLLTDREIGLREQPGTIYPPGPQRRVRAWVRFGAEAVRVHAKIVRSTPLAAGIEFRADGQTVRCWVLGNAVTGD